MARIEKKAQVLLASCFVLVFKLSKTNDENNEEPLQSGRKEFCNLI